jgi:hypothetical protein
MRNLSRIHQPLAIVALAALLTASLTPLAEASHRGTRYAPERRVVVRPWTRSIRARVAPRGSYAIWRSGSGPVVAGFLGGLFLGATITHAAPQGFVYWDPYCHRSFASLELYDAHCSGRHGGVIQVVEAEPGCDLRDSEVGDSGDPDSWDSR